MESIRTLFSIQDCNMIVKSDTKASGSFHKVINYEMKEIPGQPGYLGEYYYLNITYETVRLHTKPEIILKALIKRSALSIISSQKQVDRTIKSSSYFMKSLPYHDAVLTKAVKDWGIFRKEAELYGLLMNKYEKDPKKVIKWAPECFLAQSNMLVMEDLTRAGYRTTTFETTLNESHMKVLYDRLAQMHACALHFEINQLGGKSIGCLFNEDILFETTFTPTSGWFVAGLKGIQKIAIERNHYSKDPAKRSIIEDQLWNCLERIYTLAENTEEFRSVVVHRDLWVNNVMFQYSPGDDKCEEPTGCILIDFQLARYLPPCVDFLCALYLLTNRKHRAHYADQYVDYYFNSLQSKLTALGLDGASLLSREQFDKSLAHYRLLALVWTGVLNGFVNFPPGMLARLHQEDPETYTRMSMENRDDFILKYYDSDRFFHDRMDDIVTDLLEYLFAFE